MGGWWVGVVGVKGLRIKEERRVVRFNGCSEAVLGDFDTGMVKWW